jgi:hypothetical protein
MLSTVLGFASFVTIAFAADCYGGQGKHPAADVRRNPSFHSHIQPLTFSPQKIASSLSEKICKQNACAASDTDRGDNHYCQVSIPYSLGKMVSLQRNDPTGAFKDCIGAFHNIISQCYQTGSDSFNPNPNGK